MLDSIRDPFRRRSVALALYRMLTQVRSYSISDVRSALDLVDGDTRSAAFQACRLHNGAAYAEMPRGFHAELASQTLALFTGAPVTGDGFLKDLAVAAGYPAAHGPSVQDLDLRCADHSGDGEATEAPVIAGADGEG